MPLPTTQQYLSAPQQVYASALALSEELGIDKRLLQIARKKRLPGFHPRGKINWKDLKWEFEKHYEELMSELVDSNSSLKDSINKEKLKGLVKDNKLKDIKIRLDEKSMLDPTYVKQFLTELSIQQSVILKKIFNELPPRVTGKSEPEVKSILDASLTEIFDALKSGIGKLEINEGE